MSRARVALWVLCCASTGCAEVAGAVGAAFAQAILEAAVAGASGSGSGSGPERSNLRLHVVDAALVDNTPPGTELSARRCHQACDVGGERCWHIEAVSSDLPAVDRRPIVVCANGTVVDIGEPEFDRLEPLCRSAKLPPRHCESMCTDAPGECTLRRIPRAPVEIVSPQERVVLCLQHD
jgi:hypothetical protein